MLRGRLSKSACALALTVAESVLCPTRSSASGDKYMWCKAEGLAINAKRVFYSDPFPYEISNKDYYDEAFADYVTSRYRADSKVICYPPDGDRSRSEARLKRNKDARSSRDEGKETVFTGWTFKTYK